MSGDDSDLARTLIDSVRDFLSAPRQATLAVLGTDGSPRQVIVNYLLGDDHILLNGRSDRRWVADAQRDPRASFALCDVDDYLHWVGFRGRLEVCSEGPQALDEAMRMASYYGEDPEQHAGQDRVGFRFVPRTVFEGPK
jgi:PPOX class probable F420-dependent enzyme